MIIFDWNDKKNEMLISLRGIGFEEVVAVIEDGVILDILEHPNKVKYPNQKIYVLEINDYAYLVPHVKEKHRIFLKTIIPSRKATKIYLNK